MNDIKNYINDLSYRKKKNLKSWQIENLIIFDKDFEYWNYFLTERQIDLLCIFRNDFNYINYALTKNQISFLYRFNNNFNIKKYMKYKNCIDKLGQVYYTKDGEKCRELLK